MAYEVDFIGVSEKTADSDAIAMRWEYVLGKYKIPLFYLDNISFDHLIEAVSRGYTKPFRELKSIDNY